MNKDLIFRQLFDHETWSYTYLLGDAGSKEAILIDPVKEQAERDLALLQDLGLQLKYVLDTHLHADHITGAAKLKAATGARSGVSRVAGVKAAELALEDGEELAYGKFLLRVLATPGHTDTCLSFYSEGMVFTGDTLFVRDVGRTDFQQGSNEKMFASVREKLFALPPETYVYPAHDYQGRTVSTIGEEMRLNPKVGMKNSFAEFRAKMEAMKLAPPKRLGLAVPANQRGGAEEDEA